MLTATLTSQKDQGVAVIQHLLSYETSDPLIICSLLRCLQGGLNMFLQYCTELVVPYLQKVTFSVGVSIFL